MKFEELQRRVDAGLLVRVVAPHFVASVVYDEELDRIIEAAPILRYSMGWSRVRFREYVAGKGWTASVIPRTAPVR